MTTTTPLLYFLIFLLSLLFLSSILAPSTLAADMLAQRFGLQNCHVNPVPLLADLHPAVLLGSKTAVSGTACLTARKGANIFWARSVCFFRGLLVPPNTATHGTHFEAKTIACYLDETYCIWCSNSRVMNRPGRFSALDYWSPLCIIFTSLAWPFGDGPRLEPETVKLSRHHDHTYNYWYTYTP